MAGTVVKVDGSEVALEGPQPTTINITLRQESGLAYLCKGVAALGLRKAAAKDAGEAPRAPRPAGGGEQKVLGGAQILLGAVCIGLGVVLSMLVPDHELPYYYKRAIYNGVPFWMGGLFILSGTSVVCARHGSFWVPLATFLNLGSVVAGSVAFTLGLTEFASLIYEPYIVEELCKHRAEDRSYRFWEPTTRPPYDDERDQQRAKQCQEAFLGLVRLWSSTQILLLIVHVAALATALFCFGYGLRRLCCSSWGGWQDYVALKDPDVSPAPEKPCKEQSPA